MMATLLCPRKAVYGNFPAWFGGKSVQVCGKSVPAIPEL